MAYDGEHKLIKRYDPDVRVRDEYELMPAAPEYVERRLRERRPVLCEVAESENLVEERPDVADRTGRPRRFATGRSEATDWFPYPKSITCHRWQARVCVLLTTPSGS